MGLFSKLRWHGSRAILAPAVPRATLDLSRIDRMPESLTWPLKRDGFDPVPRIADVRDADPVHRLTSYFGITVWLVTGDAEAREVLADSVSYSNDIRPFVGRAGSMTDGDIGGLGFTDAPEHTRLRRLLRPEFTLRRLDRLQPRIAEIVDECLDRLAVAGPVADVVPDFALSVPFQVICELLGLPLDDRETLRGLVSARFDLRYGGSGALGAISGSRKFLLEFVRHQRREPGDGLVGHIVRTRADEVSDFDLAGIADGVFTGGLETSASMLALGTAVLLDHPVEYAALAAGTAEVDRTVDELLRYLSVVQVAFPRFVRQDVEIACRRIARGDVVMCHLAGANRDGALSADGSSLEAFAPHRQVGGSHLAFGHGLHRCVGAELAKRELRIAFPALARRFPDLALAASDLGFRQTSLVYGVDTLPVRLGGPGSLS